MTEQEHIIIVPPAQRYIFVVYYRHWLLLAICLKWKCACFDSYHSVLIILVTCVGL